MTPRPATAAPSPTLLDRCSVRARSAPLSVRLTGLGAAVFGLALLAVLLAPEGSRVAAWWPAAGVAVAGVALTRGRSRAGAVTVVAAASLAANVVGGRPVVLAVCFAVANTAEAAAAGWWLTRRGPASLRSPGDLGRLLVAAAGGAALAGLLAATAVVTRDGAAFTAGDLLLTWRSVAAAHAAAVLVIVPLLIPMDRRRDAVRWWEVAAHWAAAVGTTALVFSPGQELPLAFLVVPVLLGAALRSGTRSATGQLLVLGVVMTLLTSEGAGPFAAAGRTTDPVTAEALVQLFLISSALVVLALSVTVAQRESALTQLARQRAFDEGVLELVDAAVLACDATGEVVLRNAAQRRITGVADDARPTSEQVAARLRVLTETGRELPLSHSPLRRALAGEAVTREQLRILRDGAVPQDVVVTGVRIHGDDGALLGAVAAMQDVTAERAVQERLRRSLTDLRAREAELQRSNDDLAVVARVTKAVLSGGDARAAVCEAALSVADALAVVLFETDDTGENLRITCSAGIALPQLALDARGVSRTSRALRTGTIQLVPDVRGDPGFDQRFVTLVDQTYGEGALQAAIFVPIVRGDGHGAVLSIGLGGAVATADLRLLGLLDLLAGDAALALSREDLTADLVGQAMTDPLTSVANRRRWEEELRRTAATAERTGLPFTVGLLDLDRFKAFNDTFGHPAGDALLVQATRAWTGQLRVGDLLARVGGEEFAVLLNPCLVQNAGGLAQRLIDAVPLAQSCSVGLAQWVPGEPLELLMARADRALYEAKEAGRARVVLAT